MSDSGAGIKDTQNVNEVGQHGLSLVQQYIYIYIYACIYLKASPVLSACWLLACWLLDVCFLVLFFLNFSAEMCAGWLVSACQF